MICYCRNLDDEALHALSQKAPKNAKYNFYVDLSELMSRYIFVGQTDLCIKNEVLRSRHVSLS